MSTIDRWKTIPLALLLAAAACSGGGGGNGGPPTGSEPGTVAGQVTAGGAGVAGATISVTGSGSATTDAAGGFRIPNVPAGARTVTITPPAGFITASVGEPTTKTANVPAGQTANVGWTLKRGILVTANASSFSPAQVSVNVGQTVRWVSAGGSHTVTPDDASQPGVWLSTPLGPGAAFEHTFALDGSYPYHCIPHQAAGMTGTVTVQP